MAEHKPWLDGNQIYALFNQRKVWIDRERVTHEIRHMSDRHLVYLHRYLRRHYPRMRMFAFVDEAAQQMEPAWFGHDDESYHKPVEELPRHVERTPLFRALDHEMDRRGLEKLPT